MCVIDESTEITLHRTESNVVVKINIYIYIYDFRVPLYDCFIVLILFKFTKIADIVLTKAAS